MVPLVVGLVLGTAETITYSNRPGAPEPPPFWTPLVVAIAMLAAAVIFAFRRSRSAPARPALRRTRIFWSGVGGAGGIVVMQIAMARHPEAAIGVVGAGVRLAVFGAVAVVLVAAFDLLLDLLRPHRNLVWLAVALATFPAFIVLFLSASTWLGQAMDSARTFFFTAPLAAGAITWWALLPVHRPSIAHIFE